MPWVYALRLPACCARSFCDILLLTLTSSLSLRTRDGTNSPPCSLQLELSTKRPLQDSRRQPQRSQIFPRGEAPILLQRTPGRHGETKRQAAQKLGVLYSLNAPYTDSNEDIIPPGLELRTQVLLANLMHRSPATTDESGYVYALGLPGKPVQCPRSVLHARAYLRQH